MKSNQIHRSNISARSNFTLDTTLVMNVLIFPKRKFNMSLLSDLLPSAEGTLLSLGSISMAVMCVFLSKQQMQHGVRVSLQIEKWLNEIFQAI